MILVNITDNKLGSFDYPSKSVYVISFYSYAHQNIKYCQYECIILLTLRQTQMYYSLFYKLCNWKMGNSLEQSTLLRGCYNKYDS